MSCAGINNGCQKDGFIMLALELRVLKDLKMQETTYSKCMMSETKAFPGIMVGGSLCTHHGAVRSVHCDSHQKLRGKWMKRCLCSSICTAYTILVTKQTTMTKTTF